MGRPELAHYTRVVNGELERISPRENAHAKARDKKVRGPKVIAVNPGLKKLALHLATKRRKAKPS
jgi:hypothetical protein